MPTIREILIVLVMIIGFGIEVGAHIADMYVEYLTDKAADGSLIKKLRKFGPPIIAAVCLIASLGEYHIRAVLDGANRVFFVFYQYPEMSAKIRSRIYGSAAQFFTLAFAFLHFIGAVVYAVKGFRLEIVPVPLILSALQVAAKLVDCFRSHEVYVGCEVQGLRVTHATHFRGSLRMDCTICTAGCPHRGCGHCASRCVHCNQHDHTA